MIFSDDDDQSNQALDRNLSDAVCNGRILIVDDNLANVELLREILAHNGYKNITCETDSRKFSSICRSNVFDILLLDIRMPHLSGFDLIEMARKDIYAGDLVPILVLTAQTDLETRRKSLQLGANDFLNKPFVAWELLHRVRNALSTRMLYRQVVAQRNELEHRVEERTAALSAALVAAREGERAKLDFLSMMSHELRTPLNSIVGFAEVMSAPGFSPLKSSDMREYASLIEENGRALLTMVNNLLDFTRAGTGAAELSESDFSLRRLVGACVEQFAAKAQVRNVRFDKIDVEPVVLRADRRRFKDMLLSIIDNAVKFNVPGGAVCIHVYSDQTENVLRVEVKDTGAGLAETDMTRLFTPFYQGEATLKREHDGIGLGLPMVRRYAEMHGGAVEIASADEGGAVAVIKLPLTRVVGHEPAPSNKI